MILGFSILVLAAKIIYMCEQIRVVDSKDVLIQCAFIGSYKFNCTNKCARRIKEHARSTAKS